jgi:hypothetical protein
MPAANAAAFSERRQVPGNHPASELSAGQLAVFYRNFSTVQSYVADNAERITLVNRFAHRAAPIRHAHSDRFANWRARIRVAALAAIYRDAPLLRGLQP